MCRKSLSTSMKLLPLCIATLLAVGKASGATCGQTVPGCNNNSFVGIRVCPSTFTHVGDKIGFTVRIFNTDPNGCDITNANLTLHLPNGVNVPVLSNACILSPSSVPGGDAFDCPGPDPRCVDSNVADYTVTVTPAMLVHGVSGNCTPVVGTDPNTPVVVFANTTGAGTAVGSIAPDNISGCALTTVGVIQPCVSCTKTCTGGVGPNGVINFQGTVSNCTPLVNTNVPALSALTITISDDPTATIFVNGQATTSFVLQPGQSTNYTGSYSPGTCNPSTDTITVIGQDNFCTGCAGADAIKFGTNVTTASQNCTVTNTCSAPCTNSCTPVIKVYKQVVCYNNPCDAFNNDLTTQKSATAVKFGTDCPAFCYRITVTNLGNVTLSNVTLADLSVPGPNILPSSDCVLPSPFNLAPAGQANSGFTCTVQAVTRCNSDTNVVTATGVGQVTGGGTITVTDKDTNNVTVIPLNISCVLEVSTNNGATFTDSYHLNQGNCPRFVAGTTYIIRVQVINNGQWPLANVGITNTGGPCFTTPI